LNQRGARLLDLLTRHRAGDIDDRDQIPAERGCISSAGREQQHEVAILADRVMWNERQSHQTTCERQEQLEISAGRVVGKRDLEPVVAACDLHLMRG